MEGNVLVAYASKYGATREIAEKIGAVLRQSGLQADVLPVTGVRDISPYRAVILGSAIYIGKWPKEAVAFLRMNEKTLVRQPFWLFSSGPTGEGDPVELIDGKYLPDNLQPVVDRIRPRDVAVFHGNINLERINRIEKWAIKSLVKKPFGDYRDWEAIAGWAAAIGQSLQGAQLSQ